VFADGASELLSKEANAALRFVEQMTLRPELIGRTEIDEMRKLGVSEEAIIDTATVCAVFNTIDRLADAFAFHVPDEIAFDRAAPSLVKRGYALPGPVVWLTEILPAPRLTRSKRSR